ncbi:MAG: nuclear transport factor 2 family protein [Terrimicrobiaceae bacterium]
MKIRLLGALVGLLISFALPIFAQQKETVDPQTIEQIIAVGKKYDEAENNNDAASLAALFTEDAVFVTNTGPVYGRQAIEKWFRDDFQEWRHSNKLHKDDQNSPRIMGTATV